MKIILSRKGFDSANGGIVSPIFEDGTMVSFPIPSDDEDTYDSLYYNGIPYSKILHDLKYKGGNHCHVDPDLDLSRRAKEIDGWFPRIWAAKCRGCLLEEYRCCTGRHLPVFREFSLCGISKRNIPIFAGS